MAFVRSTGPVLGRLQGCRTAAFAVALLPALACTFNSSGLAGPSSAGLGPASESGDDGSATGTTEGTAEWTSTTGAGFHDGTTSEDSAVATDAGTSTGSHDDESSSDATTDADVPAAGLCETDDANLVGCWDFHDVTSGTLFDASVHANHGTVSNVILDEGPFGTAVIFGPDSVVSIPDHPALDREFDLTVEVWVRIDRLPVQERSGLLDNDGQWGLFLHPNGDLRWTGSNVLVASDVPLGEWFHLAVVVDAVHHSMYIDGHRVAQDVALPLATSNANVIAVGDESPGFNQPLSGAIGGLRIWSAPRSQAQLCEAAGADCD